MTVEHDDPRHNEEKDSDAGEAEVLSPASQGHSDPYPNDGAEDLEDQPPVGPLVSENKSSEVDPVDSVGASKGGLEVAENIEIVKEVKSEGSLEGKTVDIECVQVEPVEVSANGAEEKNNTAGFENGSQVVEKKLEQEEVEAVVLEASQFNDSVKQINSLPEEPAQVVESSLVIDSIEQMSSVSEKVIHVTETLVEETPADSLPALKDHDKKPMPLIDGASQVSETVPEVSSKKIDETATVVTDGIDGKSLNDPKEGKLLVTQEVSIARASDMVEPAKDSERPESSENLVLLQAPTQFANFRVLIVVNVEWFGLVIK